MANIKNSRRFSVSDVHIFGSDFYIWIVQNIVIHDKVIFFAKLGRQKRVRPLFC